MGLKNVQYSQMEFVAPELWDRRQMKADIGETVAWEKGDLDAGPSKAMRRGTLSRA